jgi:hypothetical protein
MLGSALMVYGLPFQIDQSRSKKSSTKIWDFFCRIFQVSTHTYSLIHNNYFSFQQEYATDKYKVEKLGMSIQKIQEFVEQSSS